MSNTEAEIIAVVGIILFFIVTGWMVTVGLQTVGGLLGLEPTRPLRFYCGHAWCGHEIGRHFTGRRVPSGVDPTALMDEIAGCRERGCRCDDYVSTSFVRSHGGDPSVIGWGARD